MMGLGEIIDANKRATREARRKGKAPLVLTTEQRAALAAGAGLEPVRLAGGFPFLADYVPRGWRIAENAEGEQLDALFVDISGQGRDGEPALTDSQLAKEIAADPHGMAYGITEYGQFQAYVTRYEREPFTPRARQHVRYISGPLTDMIGKQGTVAYTVPKKQRAGVTFDGETVSREVFYGSIARVYKTR